SSEVDNRLMKVKKVSVFGKGLEVICKYKADGGFFKRYGAYVKEGKSLLASVEVTLKDDERQDSVINKSAQDALNIIDTESYDEISALTVRISQLIKDELYKEGLDLYDIKLEFGRDEETGEILLIDEISGGNMRVYKDGNYIEPLKLNEYFFDK